MRATLLTVFVVGWMIALVGTATSSTPAAGAGLLLAAVALTGLVKILFERQSELDAQQLDAASWAKELSDRLGGSLLRADETERKIGAAAATSAELRATIDRLSVEVAGLASAVAGLSTEVEELSARTSRVEARAPSRRLHGAPLADGQKRELALGPSLAKIAAHGDQPKDDS